MTDDRRDGGDRPRDRPPRDRGDYRDSRNGGLRDRAPDNHRNRSRSPRRDRGGPRGGYRNRSPMGRGGRDRDHDRGDHRHDRDFRSARGGGPPTGPRGAPAGPKRDFKSNGAPPPSGPRAAAPASPSVDTDVKTEEQPQRARPEGMDDETWEMAQVMGFARFRSTKNTKVPGNDLNYGVRKEKKMEARQYMNRQGGFNRPLSPSRG
ncbi:hypothetical protein BU23DRAFT_560209 [Bimuria novae-zelandiae CBS 107.79]|uniref:U4/U6.U5 small nuclear ribonucleoprotein 27kDa protein domain-containing protein n=1 Tax=Bimuria novae-zelandiae CBS 107.79 TaxID=1447943 RepID=A0A6A5UR18_9PLEO|nr:hypothetical protein BU23DRAFT_560209 [Bimuria novae-zelandiae CBS 107.79]